MQVCRTLHYWNHVAVDGMTYCDLLWMGLVRRRLRTVLTLLSIVAAFTLFGLLDSERRAFALAGEGVPSVNRLITLSRFTVTVPLPLSLYARIRAVPGVVNVSYQSFLGGTYQDEKNFIPVNALEYHLLDLYPEWRVSPAEMQAFHGTRTGALAGETLAKKYHWKVGDKIPLLTNIYQKNGSRLWTFDLAGIYRITNPHLKQFEGTLLINWDYFDATRHIDNSTVGWFAVKVSNLNQAGRISSLIDALSANSDHETKTQSEQALVASDLKQIADIDIIVRSLVAAVFFTLILIVSNTMAQAVRERIPELATLKALGFSSSIIMILLFSESVLLFAVGGSLGLVASDAGVEVLRSVGDLTVPMLPISAVVWLHGLLIALVTGLAVGTPPALRGMRLRIVDGIAVQ